MALEVIYAAGERLESGETPEKGADDILTLMEKEFHQLDAIHAQNFVNFLVEFYNFFGECPGYFQRVQKLASALIVTEHLSSKTTGFTALTKLWLREDSDSSEKVDFINFLFQTAKESNQPPHLRSVCSECMRMMWHASPGTFPFSANEMLESAKTALTPTSFSELALAMTGANDEIGSFYGERWWSMSPFETVSFHPEYKLEVPAVPNDPLLLHAALAAKAVPKETALAIINSPMSAFGVPSVVQDFGADFGLDGATIFLPYDTDEEIATKAYLLPATVASISENSVLAAFKDQPTNSPIVSAVFDVACRFSVTEVFEFFRKYFPETSAHDGRWFFLYQIQPVQVQQALRCFLSGYMERIASQRILLESEDRIHSLALINAVSDASVVPLLVRFAKNEGSEEGRLARAKIDEHGMSNLLQAVTPKAASVPLPTIQTVQDSFGIVNKMVSTTDRTKTTVGLSIESLLESASPVYGVSFVLGNRNFFEEDAVVLVPSVSRACQVQFTMRPKRIARCQLTMTATYTTADGCTCTCTLANDPNLVIEPWMLLSPSSEPFAAIWAVGEESRIRLDTPFKSFKQAIGDTGFAGQYADDVVESTAVTPDGDHVAIRGITSGQQTMVQFKAPSLQLLLLIDDFLRGLV